MKARIIFTAIALVCFGSMACNDSRESSINTTTDRTSLPTPVSNTNTSVAATTNMSNDNTAAMQDEFWAEAARGGMAEVELGKLAAAKAQNAEIKKFGQMMVTDHSKANNELKALATKKNITLPTMVSSSQKSTMDDLQGLSGAEFDAAYVDAMVEDHQSTVNTFEDQATEGSDTDLKAFAAKTLPTLKKHLDMINAIKGKMK